MLLAYNKTMLVKLMAHDWQLGDVQISSKGIKSAPVTDKKGNPVFCTGDLYSVQGNPEFCT